jgi:predicted enzyme related to lactoylglutathione lyase
VRALPSTELVARSAISLPRRRPDTVTELRAVNRRILERVWRLAAEPSRAAYRLGCETVSVTVRRIIPYHESRDFDATRAFYTRVLNLEEGSFGGGYIGFGSGPAQVLFAPPDVKPVLPDMGIDVGSRAAVDTAHTEATQRGHEVIYGPVDEPWGVRRFFVRDPNGVVISVLAHD